MLIFYIGIEFILLGSYAGSCCFLKKALIRHLQDNLDDWLDEQLENYLDDDYLVFDCPGTILNACLHALIIFY